jgi:hypothetical protein
LFSGGASAPPLSRPPPLSPPPPPSLPPPVVGAESSGGACSGSEGTLSTVFGADAGSSAHTDGDEAEGVVGDDSGEGADPGEGEGEGEGVGVGVTGGTGGAGGAPTGSAGDVDGAGGNHDGKMIGTSPAAPTSPSAGRGRAARAVGKTTACSKPGRRGDGGALVCVAGACVGSSRAIGASRFGSRPATARTVSAANPGGSATRVRYASASRPAPRRREITTKAKMAADPSLDNRLWRPKLRAQSGGDTTSFRGRTGCPLWGTRYQELNAGIGRTAYRGVQR